MVGRCTTCGGEHPEGPEHCPGQSPAAAGTVPRAADAEPATALPRGTMLEGVYRVGECIGRGAMGAVYVVEHVELGKRFAAKVLSGFTGADGQAVQRLQNEARAASAADHENIVNVTHLGRTEKGSVFVVMELLEGENLRARLLRQAALGGPNWLPDEEARSLGEQILAGLGAAHRAGVVHRDLKPENVLLARKSGRVVVKLVDFGISKLGSPTDARLTQTGQVFGTPLYMSPEQARSAASVDHRTDLYAAGVILYELTTGTVPFEGESASECLVQHATEPPPPPSLRRPGLPAAVEAVILKCLAKKPDDRYGSAEELLGAWRGAWTAPPVSALAGTPEPTTRETAAPKRARRASLAVAALVAAGVAVWLGSMAVSPRPRGRARPRKGAAAASPLGDAGAVLACPLLRASGVDAPSQWLGAAAASIVCERARVLLGGRFERTLIPAELLDLPRPPADDFPADPYGQPRAVERSVAAARARAAAYFEGEVTTTDPGFRVALRLKTKEGRELGHAEGRGAALYVAVRAAMEPLVTPGALPRAARLDAEIAEWTRATTVEAALALVDVRFAHYQGGGAWLPDECRHVRAQGAAIGENLLVQQTWCAGDLMEPAPTVPGVLLDDRSHAALRITAYQVMLLGDLAAKRDAFARLERARATESSPLGRALLASVQSGIAQSTNPDRAVELALLAVEAHVKTNDGDLCPPLIQLGSIHQPAQRAMDAWVPWYLYDFGYDLHLEVAKRRLEVSPFALQSLWSFVDASLASGRSQDARRAALRLSLGGPRERLGAEFFLARVDASEARFRLAMDRATRALAVPPGRTRWVTEMHLSVVWGALRVAQIVGDGQDWADRNALPLVDTAAFRGPSGDMQSHIQLAVICARVSPPRRPECFTRLRALTSGGYLTNDPPDGEGLVQGLERFAAGDYRAAALAWRPAVRPLLDPAFSESCMWDELAEAFDHTGELDLADRVDEALTRGRLLYNGVNLAHVRMARRAARRGQRDKALELARKVIDAWSVADVSVPAVDEMRRLVARLGAARQ